MEDLYKQARISRVSQCTKLAVHETGFACHPSRSADEQVHFSSSDNVTPSVPSPNATWICFLLSLSRTLFLLSIRPVALCTTSSQQSQPAFIQTSSSFEYPHSSCNMSIVSISVFLVFFSSSDFREVGGGFTIIHKRTSPNLATGQRDLLELIIDQIWHLLQLSS
jgi:hypothetical protein